MPPRGHRRTPALCGCVRNTVVGACPNGRQPGRPQSHTSGWKVWVQLDRCQAPNCRMPQDAPATTVATVHAYCHACTTSARPFVMAPLPMLRVVRHNVQETPAIRRIWEELPTEDSRDWTARSEGIVSGRRGEIDLFIPYTPGPTHGGPSQATRTTPVTTGMSTMTISTSNRDLPPRLETPSLTHSGCGPPREGMQSSRSMQSYRNRPTNPEASGNIFGFSQTPAPTASDARRSLIVRLRYRGRDDRAPVERSRSPSRRSTPERLIQASSGPSRNPQTYAARSPAAFQSTSRPSSRPSSRQPTPTGSTRLSPSAQTPGMPDSFNELYEELMYGSRSRPGSREGSRPSSRLSSRWS